MAKRTVFAAHERCPDPGAPNVVYLRAGSHRAFDRLACALRDTGRPVACGRFGDYPGACKINTGRGRFGLGTREVVPVTEREAKAVLAKSIPGVSRARVPTGARPWPGLEAFLPPGWGPGMKRPVWPDFWPDAK